MTIKKDCIATARQALNLFTDKELEQYIKNVSRRAKQLQKDGVPFARKAAIKEINAEQLESLLNDSASAARNIGKHDEIKSIMAKGIKPQSFIEKTSTNTAYNAETAVNAVRQELHNEAFGTFT